MLAELLAATRAFADGAPDERHRLHRAVRGLLERLAALKPRPTIVMVAHRAESLAHCDQVVTIARGRSLSPGAGIQQGVALGYSDAG